MKAATLQELVRAISERYRAAARDAKGKILDEFVRITGYHRQHAVRLLGGNPASETERRRRAEHGVTTRRSATL